MCGHGGEAVEGNQELKLGKKKIALIPMFLEGISKANSKPEERQLW